MGLDILHGLVAIWPIVNTLVLVVLAISSFGWKLASKRIEGMGTQITALSLTMQATVTTLAVVQSNVLSHVEQDRTSFHEMRADIAARVTELTHRLNVQQSTLDSLRPRQ